MGHLVMDITNYPPINEANIEINKINVIGGVNGSGKSTVSKVLYAFLKGNSTKRRYYALQRIVESINEIIEELNFEGNEYNLPEPISVNDNYSYIIKKYNEILEIYEKYCDLAKIKVVEINNEMKGIVNNLIETLEDNYCNKNELTIIYDSIKKQFESNVYRSDLYIYPENIIKEIQDHENIRSWDLVLASFESTMLRYEYQRNIPFAKVLLTEELQYFENELNKISNLERQWNYFLKFILFDFPSPFQIIDFDFPENMDRFFDEDCPDISKDAVDGILFNLSNRNMLYVAGKFDINFYIDLDGSKYDAYDYFFNNFINSAYYVDNVSLIDLWNPKNREKIKLSHMEEILDDLFNRGLKDNLNLNQDVINILDKIENIIKGTFDKWYPGFSFGKNGKKSKLIPEDHISSGIKQIGIIQALLLNDKLKRDGYLIIDEPEVNLHPDWQFKFAEILVLLAKDLNITVYLNSHSPFFIEAMDAFTEFYEMSEDVNYYLTEESEVEGRYNFTKIESDELYKIYNNLGNAYDLINQLRLRKRLK